MGWDVYLNSPEAGRGMIPRICKEHARPPGGRANLAQDRISHIKCGTVRYVEEADLSGRGPYLLSPFRAVPGRVGVMSPRFSSYLDVVRLLSALVVFCHHAGYARFGGSWIAWSGTHGHHAVIVFFVLSGFVIAHVHETKEHTLGQYAASRFARLWSVGLPAIALTVGMDALGRVLVPEAYQAVCVPSLSDVLVTGFFMHQTAVATACVGSNIPFWSLSYEFAYYCLFAAFVFAPWRWAASGVVALMAGPVILLLFPAWLAGWGAYRVAKRPLTARAAWLFAVLPLLAFLALIWFKVGNLYVTWRVETYALTAWQWKLADSRAFITDNILALLFAGHLVGMACLCREGSGFPAWVRVASDATFPIYLLHYPCLAFFSALSLHLTGQLQGIAISAASLAVPILLTGPTNIWKHGMRRRILAHLPG